MNERIKELADQAGCGAFVDEYAPFKKDFEKFAELIIKECAAMDYRARLPILQHFGVE